MKTKNKIILLIGITVATLMYSTTSHAALQANGNSGKTDTIANWLLNIRKMEAVGGTLGLTDTINTTNLTSSSENSNNLDIHMELNTEYGAMAILSASSYGNPNKINGGETTTGNKSGVYINLNKEWVSAGTSDSTVSQFKNANAKYKNIYPTTFGYKIGDALKECEGWHGSTSSASTIKKSVTMLRAYGGSVFSSSTYGTNGSPEAANSKSNYARAVVVVGNGL